ncbi:MAG: hypothetical protein RR315_06985, partial [Oscillospiraceae bacterium]
MKKLGVFLCLLIYLMAFGGIFVGAASFPVGGAGALAVLDCRSESFIYEKNLHKPMAIASTTKIMTAYLSLLQEDLDTEFKLSEAALRTEGSTMGLMLGDSA